jgi:alkanesulfonate monooxygenase SsuD/methylene tetrahydromethanopterin reductase-like flavin-dependent oxidoreductase (luciferase family)
MTDDAIAGMAVETKSESYLAAGHTLLSWLTTTDHKRIAILYVISITFFFFIGGIAIDPTKMHVLDHKGRYLSVRGPLNIARPVQGWLVIGRAGASETGRQLAAETAEAVFTAQSDLAAGQQFYADVNGRREELGRSREHMKILPACFVVVGDRMEEARAKRAKLPRPKRRRHEEFSVVNVHWQLIMTLPDRSPA